MSVWWLTHNMIYGQFIIQEEDDGLFPPGPIPISFVFLQLLVYHVLKEVSILCFLFFLPAFFLSCFTNQAKSLVKLIYRV